MIVSNEVDIYLQQHLQRYIDNLVDRNVDVDVVSDLTPDNAMPTDSLNLSEILESSTPKQVVDVDAVSIEPVQLADKPVQVDKMATKKGAKFGETRYYRVNFHKRILWKSGHRFKHECEVGDCSGILGSVINQYWETYGSYQIIKQERRGGPRENSGRPLSESKKSEAKLKAPDFLVDTIRNIKFKGSGFSGIGDYLSNLIMSVPKVTDEIIYKVGYFPVDRQFAISEPAMNHLRELQAQVVAIKGGDVSLGCILAALWLTKKDGLGSNNPISLI